MIAQVKGHTWVKGHVSTALSRHTGRPSIPCRVYAVCIGLSQCITATKAISNQHVCCWLQNQRSPATKGGLVLSLELAHVALTQADVEALTVDDLAELWKVSPASHG